MGKEKGPSIGPLPPKVPGGQRVMVLDKEDKACYVIEFKRAFERYGGAQEKTRQKAEGQHGNLVQGLTGALDDSTWRVILVVFVGGMCGSVEEKALNANMELMGVIESERNAIRKRHATEAGVQLLSESNLAGGVREGRRRVEAKISS